jgi:hypothetical protein
VDNRKFYGVLLVIGAIGLILRVYGFVFALEYDEIWTMENYAVRSVHHIFTDIATPNNHPLNSLQMKYTADILFPWSIRLIPFLCGVLLIPLAGAVGRRFWNWPAGLSCALLVAVSPPLIQYSSLARGYSIQVFLLALAAYALAWLDRKSFEAKYAVLFVACGIGAILTVATSVLYLFPLGLYLLWLARQALSGADQKQRRNGWILLGAAGGLALFTLLWFLGNLSQYQQFKGWGTPLTAASFFPWVVEVFSALGVPVYLVAGAGIFAVYRKRTNLIPVWMILLPLAAAFFTNAGPARTFLPLLLLSFLVMGAAVGEIWDLKHPKAKWLAGILLVLACAGCLSTYRQWKSTDWVQMYETMRNISDDTLIVYDANDSFPLRWNNGDAILEDYLKRVRLPSEQVKMLAVTGDTSGINGLDHTFSVRSEKLGGGFVSPQGPFPVIFYGLEALRDAALPGELLLIQIRPMADYVFKYWMNNLDRARNLLTCSVWLSSQASGIAPGYRYALVVMRVTEAAGIEFLELADRTNGAVSVYRIKPMAELR